MASRIERYAPQVQSFGTRGILFHTAIARIVGLTLTEFNCFRLAARLGGATATDLARETGLTLPAMTAIVDRLVELRFVRRQRDTNDRRRVFISVERKAWERMNAHYVRHAGRIADLLDSYSEAQFEFLLKYMHDVALLLEEAVIRLAEEEQGSRSPRNGKAARTARAATTRRKLR
jgi:DNA-binding MarR family transcriptional regulator